jgi:2-(1,2-epoxy-1,2-dihydrophenyl)acetyl-CoA isomerase
MLLTNRVIGTEQALQWGLVTEMTDDETVDERAIALAASLAAGPAVALGQSRRLVRGSWEMSRAETGRDEARTIGRAVVTEDAMQLLNKFAAR